MAGSAGGGGDNDVVQAGQPETTVPSESHSPAATADAEPEMIDDLFLRIIGNPDIDAPSRPPSPAELDEWISALSPGGECK